MVKKVLIVEDDPSKANKIIKHLEENYSYSISHSSSYKSGINEILYKKFDLIILDMSIPTYDGIDGNFSGKPKSFGGKNILKEMKRFKIFTPVIVVSQYNEFDGGVISLTDLDSELKDKYSSNYLGYILYKNSGGDWDKKLSEIITSRI